MPGPDGGTAKDSLMGGGARDSGSESDGDDGEDDDSESDEDSDGERDEGADGDRRMTVDRKDEDRGREDDRGDRHAGESLGALGGGFVQRRPDMAGDGRGGLCVVSLCSGS